MTREDILAKATPRPWDTACDSYGKVQHSRKACVYANTKGENGDRLVIIAGRIENWQDAELVKLAVNAYESDRELIRQLVEALEALRNQSKGFVSLCRVSDVGATNVRVMNIRINEADAALAVAKQREEKQP